MLYHPHDSNPDFDRDSGVNLGSDSESPVFLEGLILAGGNSRRMGRDKALLSWPRGEGLVGEGSASEPLLTHICRVAQEICERVSVLTPRCERYAPLLPAGCRCLQESRAESEPPPGPLVAFAEGLAQLSADWVLLLACDLPGIEPLQLQSWRDQLEQMEQTSPEMNALLPRRPKGWEPLCGFYRRQVLDSLQRAIREGEQSFQCWLAYQTVVALPVEADTVLQNCNTLEEWERYLQRSSRSLLPSDGDSRGQ